MPVVKRDPGGVWNRNRELRFAFADKLFCWNVVFWPLVLANQRSDDELLVAIFRATKSRRTDRHQNSLVR
jgi:hypothetical protein